MLYIKEFVTENSDPATMLNRMSFTDSEKVTKTANSPIIPATERAAYDTPVYESDPYGQPDPKLAHPLGVDLQKGIK